MYARHEDEDEWEKIPYRDSLWTDDLRATGVVFSNDDFYNIIQYGGILETVGDAVEQQKDEMNLDVAGRVSLSPTAHKMSAQVDFSGATTVYAGENDPIELGLKIRSGHSGYHAVKYDIGAERQVCSNGMMAFISECHFEQTHQEPFQPGLAYNAVNAVIERPEQVEQRIEAAHDHEFMNQDEALLVLLDLGVDHYLEQPVPDLLNTMLDEIADPENPTLWETYNTATRALTHLASENIPNYELDDGYERAAQLLETGTSTLPDPTHLGRATVERRASHLADQPDEAYWPGEADAISQLAAAYGIDT